MLELLVSLYGGPADAAITYVEDVVAWKAPELAGTAQALSVNFRS